MPPTEWRATDHRGRVVPLEDHAGDVVSKAMRGLGLTAEALARASGLTPGEVASARAGQGPAPAWAALAPPLQLDGAALAALAAGALRPPPLEIGDLVVLSLPYEGDLAVNVALLRDPGTSEAIVFDTGTLPELVLAAARDLGLSLRLVLLTHAHGDHVEGLPALQAATGCPALASGREPVEGAGIFADDEVLTFGGLRLTARPTPGHAAGGTTFLLEGLSRPVAVVGDALFSGSIGGVRSPAAWDVARRACRDVILALAPETVLVPGHGPLTTVGFERAHNPFFPDLR